MVRWVRSRAVAISTGWASAAGSVRSATARAIGATARGCTSGTARAAIGAVTAGSGGALAILTIALGANHHPPSPNHRSIHSFDYARRVLFGHFDQGMTLSQVDLSDAIARNSSLPRNRAHQVSDFDSVASANGHEQPRHSAAAA